MRHHVSTQQTTKTHTGSASTRIAGQKPAAKPLIARLRWRKVIVALLVCYAVFHLVSGCGSIIELKSQERQIAIATEKAMVEKAEWEEKVAYMSSDAAVEKVAREQLGLVKPGEIAVVRLNTPEGQEATP